MPSNQLITNDSKLYLSKNKIYITDIRNNYNIIPNGEEIFIDFILKAITKQLKKLYAKRVIYEVMHNFNKIVHNAIHVK